MSGCHEAAMKRAEDAEAMVEDVKKIAAAWSKDMERNAREITRLKKQLEGIKAQHAQELEEILHEPKKSAAMTVIRARIQMVEQAAGEGFDVKVWDLQGWRTALIGLGGDVAVTSGKGEAEVEKDGGQCGVDDRVVEQGDEGKYVEA